jgi:tetratricopeptide (TPR) repeat protein
MKRNIFILLIVASILVVFSNLIFASETIDEKDYIKDIEAYKQAIRINPNDATAYYNLGNAYDSLGLYKEAIEAYEQAILIDPMECTPVTRHFYRKIRLVV